MIQKTLVVSGQNVLKSCIVTGTCRHLTTVQSTGVGGSEASGRFERGVPNGRGDIRIRLPVHCLRALPDGNHTVTQLCHPIPCERTTSDNRLPVLEWEQKGANHEKLPTAP